MLPKTKKHRVKWTKKEIFATVPIDIGRESYYKRKREREKGRNRHRSWGHFKSYGKKDLRCTRCDDDGWFADPNLPRVLACHKCSGKLNASGAARLSRGKRGCGAALWTRLGLVWLETFKLECMLALKMSVRWRGARCNKSLSQLVSPFWGTRKNSCEWRFF